VSASHFTHLNDKHFYTGTYHHHHHHQDYRLISEQHHHQVKHEYTTELTEVKRSVLLDRKAAVSSTTGPEKLSQPMI